MNGSWFAVLLGLDAATFLAVGLLLWKAGRWSGSVDERFKSAFHRLDHIEDRID